MFWLASGLKKEVVLPTGKNFFIQTECLAVKKLNIDRAEIRVWHILYLSCASDNISRDSSIYSKIKRKLLTTQDRQGSRKFTYQYQSIEDASKGEMKGKRKLQDAA